MPNIACELHAHSTSPHLDQLYSGFSALHRAGVIDLSQRIIKINPLVPARPQHLRNARHAHLTVRVNKRLTIHYDTHDSWEIDEEFLGEADHYFKRSFSAERLRQHGVDTGKIHALGLNYRVLSDGLDRFALKRSWSMEPTVAKQLAGLLRSTGRFDSAIYSRRVRTMQGLPDLEADPRVLFMTRAWDPKDNAERTNEKAEERERLNEMRAGCIRLLRKEFGAAFFGGLAHSDYSKAHYNDVLLPAGEISSHQSYLGLLRSYPICVATAGLHESTGGKFTEYVCHSKAIVSEKLCYEVPGRFGPGTNYLEFTSPEECVQQAVELFSNRSLRRELMLNNARYYHSHVRPDMLVLNSMLEALGAGTIT